MTFREPLPAGCPPEEAERITGSRTVYRIVRCDPPADHDFQSQRALNPDQVFGGVTECQVRGLSVFDDIKTARSLLASSKFRGWAICQVNLTNGSGYIQRTGRRNHFTWWPLANFEILVCCVVVPL